MQKKKKTPTFVYILKSSKCDYFNISMQPKAMFAHSGSAGILVVIHVNRVTGQILKST